jgi:hypothetical protein
MPAVTDMQRYDAYDIDLDFDALAAEYGVPDEPVAPLYPQASSSRAVAWAEPSAQRASHAGRSTPATAY